MFSLGGIDSGGRDVELPGLCVDRGGGAGLSLTIRDLADGTELTLGRSGDDVDFVGVGDLASLAGDPVGIGGTGGTGGGVDVDGCGVRDRVADADAGTGVGAIMRECSGFSWGYRNGGGEVLSFGSLARSSSSKKRKSNPTSCSCCWSQSAAQ